MSYWYDSTPKKSRRKRDSNPGSSPLEADALPLGQRGGLDQEERSVRGKEEDDDSEVIVKMMLMTTTTIMIILTTVMITTLKMTTMMTNL